MDEKDKIKIIHNNDHDLKLIGELLSNETSRKIMKLLISQESYTNEIATKLDIRVSLVIHHLKKLEELGLLKITEKKIGKKGNYHRHFKMIPGLFVMPNETKEEVKEKGTLKKIFKEGIKFAVIGSISLFTWFQVQRTPNSINGDVFDYGPVLDLPFYEQSIFFPMLIIILGLIINTIVIKKKKKSH